MNHQFSHPSSLKNTNNNNLIRAPFLSPPSKITQPKTHIDTPVVTQRTMFNNNHQQHHSSLPSGTQDDSVLNNRDRLRRQHLNRHNMPSTPTLGKSNHFQENANPQQQPGQPGTSFTIELSTAPKKGPPQHLLERLSKKTSVAKSVKDSEMGDGNNTQMQQPATTTAATTTGSANNTAITANQRRQTILEFQKRKSTTATTLKNSLNKPTQANPPNLTYTTFDTNGLTLDDDLEIGFEKSGSPIVSLNGLNRASQPSPNNFAFGAQQNVNSQPNIPAQQGFQQPQQFGGFNQQQENNNQPNPQWQIEQQQLEQQQRVAEQQKLEQQQLEQQRMTEQQRVAAEQLLQQQQLEQQRMAEQQRLRDQQQQQQLDQLNEQQRAAAEQQILQQKQMEQQRMLDQQRIEQEKLQQQFAEQQRNAEQQRIAAEQQHLLQQQQMWQAQQVSHQPQPQSQMQYIPVYQTVPSEEVQRMIHEVQRQQAEFERQRQAQMEIIQRERAELELGRELLRRQQLELQAKLNEVDQIKMGLPPSTERRNSIDARRNEVEANRNIKRTAQRQEIIKSKRELNLLNVDKLSRTSREIKREEREEEKKRTRSMLPEGIFSPPRAKPTLSRPSMYGSRTTPSSVTKSDISTGRKTIETPTSLYSPASSMRGSIRSSVSTSKSNSREMASPSNQLSKRKQMVLEKTRRKAEEFSRKSTSNNNTPCQH